MSKDYQPWITNQPKGTFSLLPHAISRSAFLDSYEKNVWCYLSTHSSHFHPSEVMIAENTGIKEKTVRSVIDRLIKKNVIEITNLPRRPGKKKKYRLVEPKHWIAEPVWETGSLAQETNSEAWENRSLGPGIENEENNLIENQEIRDEEPQRTINILEINPKFREDVAGILTRSEGIDSTTLHFSSLIKTYTALNGESPSELNWLLKKAREWSKRMNLNYFAEEKLKWSLIRASSDGSAEHRSKSTVAE